MTTITITYTYRERTLKNHAVGEAVKIVEQRLDGVRMCTDALKHRDLSDKITLVELNELADKLVDDSFYSDCKEL